MNTAPNRPKTRKQMVAFLYGIGIGGDMVADATDNEIREMYERARKIPLIQTLAQDFWE